MPLASVAVDFCVDLSISAEVLKLLAYVEKKSFVCFSIGLS